MQIKLVFTDIDGVWTDGGMYYDQLGNELKKFHTYDSAGVLLCRMHDIPVVVITGENTEIVARRCTKLGITHVYQGVKNKLDVARRVAGELGVPLAEAAYMGDDVPDIPLLEAVGFSGAPANAPEYVHSRVRYVTAKCGGEGAFREFVETLLGADRVSASVKRWLEGI
ncbi:MAG: HAD hydrolase family protein [Flavobacteriales bacterium]|nr:HAD hydrolase family protein [Flavobacteriales bacterium]